MSTQPQATANGENNNARQNSGANVAQEDSFDIVDSYKRKTAGFFHRLLEEFEPPGPEESWKTFVLWISLIVIDPLICYVPAIHDEKRLLDFDRTLSAVLLMLYGLAYVLKISIYVYKFKKSDVAAPYSKPRWLFVAFAPLVPVVTNGLLLLILIVKPTTIIKASIFSIGTAIFFFLYLVRVLGIYKLFIAAASPSDKKVKTALFRILVNLLLYLYGGHLFGSLWYFFAVWKKMECWSKACKFHRGQCYYAHHRFIVNSGDNTLLDDICFSKTEDTTYELGIFKDALESRIVETRSIAKKLLYCFRWGLQTISGYGQNLEVSTHAWENIFVVVITIYGMATFTFFIGNMQNLLKSSIPTSKSEKTKWTREDLEKWSPFKNLSENLQMRIINECQQCNSPQTGDVNLKNLLSNLSKNIRNDIRCELCLSFLRKVEEFRNWSDELMAELCHCAKLVSYEEHAQIIQNGSSIDKMLFLVEGRLQTFTSVNAGSSSTAGENFFDHLEFDDICGEELVAWFRDDPYSSGLPISSKTIRVVRNVDAFALMFYDLQNVYKRQAALKSMQEQEHLAEPSRKQEL